jgi:hypothetical protein
MQPTKALVDGIHDNADDTVPGTLSACHEKLRTSRKNPVPDSCITKLNTLVNTLVGTLARCDETSAKPTPRPHEQAVHVSGVTNLTTKLTPFRQSGAMMRPIDRNGGSVWRKSWSSQFHDAS